MAELLCWAEENGFDKTYVKAALRRRVEAESTNAGDGTMARPAVAKIVGTRKSPPETLGDSIPQTTKIPGTSLAPRWKEKLPTTKMVLSGTTVIEQVSATAPMANLYRVGNQRYLF